MRYHVNIIYCMQPNFLLTCQLYPMLMSSVPQAWGTLDRKSALFKLIVIFFLNGVVFMFWHDIVYIELLYCVTNFELVWTWNKVAVVENAKKCRLYPPYPNYFWTITCCIARIYINKAKFSSWTSVELPCTVIAIWHYKTPHTNGKFAFNSKPDT